MSLLRFALRSTSLARAIRSTLYNLKEAVELLLETAFPAEIAERLNGEDRE